MATIKTPQPTEINIQLPHLIQTVNHHALHPQLNHKPVAKQPLKQNHLCNSTSHFITTVLSYFNPSITTTQTHARYQPANQTIQITQSHHCSLPRTRRPCAQSTPCLPHASSSFATTPSLLTAAPAAAPFTKPKSPITASFPAPLPRRRLPLGTHSQHRSKFDAGLPAPLAFCRSTQAVSPRLAVASTQPSSPLIAVPAMDPCPLPRRAALRQSYRRPCPCFNSPLQQPPRRPASALLSARRFCNKRKERKKKSEEEKMNELEK
ncbi:hypothetical protein M0R45_035292 [Rubus argutus]|uniref:Uncharacterized protein n=1 Tax=Rubus argutus TaxID=59490 RepID=A0AAW1VWI2_RUBAR